MKRISIVVLLLVAMVTTGCLGIFGQKFTVTVEYDEEMGTVEGVAKSYKKEAVTDILAVANSGYKFSHWSGDVPEDFATENPLQIPVEDNLEIVANFEEDASYVESTLEPSADTHITGDWRKVDNFGDAKSLEVKDDGAESANNSHRKAFLRFDISDLADWSEFRSAKFRIYVEEFADPGILEEIKLGFYDISGEEWAEDELTWENASEELHDGGVEITKVAIGDDDLETWVEIDVLEFVQNSISEGIGELSIKIECETPSYASLVYFTSREGEEEHRPNLLLVGSE